MTELTVELLKKLYKKCKELEIPKTIDGKYYIADDKTREEYNKKIRREEDNGKRDKRDQKTS